MNVSGNLMNKRIVKIGPSLRERMSKGMASAHHRRVIAQLRRFREDLQRDMAPEDWTNLRAPMLLALCDICDVLGLSEKQRSEVLGARGEQVLRRMLQARYTVVDQDCRI